MFPHKVYEIQQYKIKATSWVFSQVISQVTTHVVSSSYQEIQVIDTVMQNNIILSPDWTICFEQGSLQNNIAQTSILNPW